MQPDKPLDVVCGIIVHDDHILATRRDRISNMPLLWEFPGGKIENGESPEAALHRELKEELHLDVEIIRPLDPVEQETSGLTIRLIPFLVKPAQKNGPVPIDHCEIRWIQIQESGQLTWAPADIPLVENLSTLISNHD